MGIYCRGKVYQVVDLRKPEGSPGRCAYVGSTVRSLKKRWACHRSAYTGIGMFIRDYGVANFRIELVESCPCTCKRELREREQYHMDNLKPTKNIQRACCEIKVAGKCECGLVIKDMAKHLRNGRHDKRMRRKRTKPVTTGEWRKFTSTQRASYLEQLYG